MSMIKALINERLHELELTIKSKQEHIRRVSEEVLELESEANLIRKEIIKFFPPEFS